eukprot:6063418-Amphidinium_carterae.1
MMIGRNNRRLKPRELVPPPNQARGASPGARRLQEENAALKSQLTDLAATVKELQCMLVSKNEHPEQRVYSPPKPKKKAR